MPQCVYCRMAKDFLSKTGIPYEEVDVSIDAEAGDEMVKKTGQMGVPVIEMGDDIIIGFNRGQLEDSLKKHGYIS